MTLQFKSHSARKCQSVEWITLSSRFLAHIPKNYLGRVLHSVITGYRSGHFGEKCAYISYRWPAFGSSCTFSVILFWFCIMFALFSGLWKYLFQKDEYCILILGLDNAGKSVRYSGNFVNHQIELDSIVHDLSGDVTSRQKQQSVFLKRLEIMALHVCNWLTMKTVFCPSAWLIGLIFHVDLHVCSSKRQNYIILSVLSHAQRAQFLIHYILTSLVENLLWKF